MDNTLADFHAALCDARDKDAAWSLLLEYTRSLGLEHVHTWFGTTPEDMTVATTCPDWWAPYYMQKQLWRHDVFWQHCMGGHGPMTYGVNAHGRNPAMPEESIGIINTLRHHIDLACGFGFPLFTPGGERIGGINLGISGTLEDLDKIPASHIMAAAMAATSAHTKSHAMDNMGLASARLTMRERECLLWLSKGLRTKDISDKLNLSDHTVNFHINNAKARLGAETREQAVARAVVLGLIAP